jgi:hypothetical protein
MSDADGAAVSNSDHTFLAFQATDKCGVGASLRWVIGAASTSVLHLELQALPAHDRYHNIAAAYRLITRSSSS